MSYNHLTIEERSVIYALRRDGRSIRFIASSINRSPSTVSRELKRNYCGTKYTYLPHVAQKKYNNRRKSCHRAININDELISYLSQKIEETWSPEQISMRGNTSLDLPSFSTIYRWIHRGLLPKIEMKKLRRKGKFRRPQETRGRFNIGKRISKRPREVYKRKTLGHWEVDTVESGRIQHQRKSKYCFVTLAERKSRQYIAKLLPNRTEPVVTSAIIELLSEYPSNLVKTITCDRGKEFAGYREIEEKLQCDVYFADPYCAWQRGTNENSNGLLREFYPKGMDLSLTTNDELKKYLDLMNNRPRKCNEFKTPNEVINEYIYDCCT